MDRVVLRTGGLVVAGKQVPRYAITDLCGQGALPGLDTPLARKAQLREQVRRWAVDGVDIVQLREKRLESGEVYDLACMAMDEIRGAATPSHRTRLLINGRADAAAAAGADGVHLTCSPGELLPDQVRAVFRAAGHARCLVSISCHAVAEVAARRDAGADLILFGPIFGKQIAGKPVTPATGLKRLAEAVAAAGRTPLLALGGVTEANKESCLQAGAAGIAGIRLFT